MDTTIARDENCFCCGRHNERGLHLTFSYPDEVSSETQLEIPGYFSGWKKTVHGGLLAMLLDEAMAHACIRMERSAVTAEMTVRYLKPASLGERITVKGRVTQTRARVLETEGWIYGQNGGLLAQAKARYLSM